MKPATDKTSRITVKARLVVEVDALVAFGVSVAEACRRTGLSRITYYRAKALQKQTAEDAA